MTRSKNSDKQALAGKQQRLHEIITALDSVAVAYSGGVDSSYLLAVCIDVLGPERVLALTADSPLMPRAELERAKDLARSLGAQHRLVPIDELAIPEVAGNPPRRCYHCKRARFVALAQVANAERHLREAGGARLLHGENADDQGDRRPGAVAARELGVRAPLAEAGLTKTEIRELSRRRGLPTWNQPAAACLATRFPYGTPLTREGLERVERGEDLLREVLGAIQVRLRDHYPMARIEVPPGEMVRLITPEFRTEIAQALRALGYRYVTLDLDGYRMGSMDEGIK